KVIVTRRNPPMSRVKKISLDNIPDPTPHAFSDTWSAFISGVGGMGVGVLSSTLARAGTKEGYTVKFNDKKGLAIRNGAVSAHISYAKGKAKISTIVPNGKADLLLGLDMLEAERSLLYASQGRTTAVVNSSVIPTIPMLAGMMNYPPDVEDNIRKHTNSDDYISGRIGEISELYYGNKLFTNIILLGMAFQRGLIPVSEKNLVEAIMETVSPSQRARNTEAFKLGRKLAAEPEYMEFKNIVADEKILRLFGAKETYQQLLERKANTIAHSYWMFWKGKAASDAYVNLVQSTVAKLNLDEETNRNLARRIYDMVMWGGLNYAQDYVSRVLEVFNNDRPDKNYQATRSVILNLAKVNAIKDEVYTPLLLTDEEKLERDKIRYNIDEENGDRIKYAHLNRPEFEIFGRQVRFNLPQWLAHNWLMNIFKHAKFARGILTRWGWHKKEIGFRDWYHDDVIGYFLKTAPSNYELALRALRVINDPYRPNEFAVTGFREVIYPKMEKARKEFERLIGPSPPVPEIPVLAS
ncbi:MAG TPA: 2-oxoacid:acceptor oxidoreductase family protein, partial [Candidatus Bathyarchaeia archaeon]|nr:2-oxoacid:acceptor oxidoreductase family protein [Candidatus Bathyarchaeia archaeon]